MNETVNIFIKIMVYRQTQRDARCVVHKHTHGDVLVPLVIHFEIGEILCDRSVKFDLSLVDKLHDRQCGIHFAYRRNAIYPFLRSGCFVCKFRWCGFSIHRISNRCVYSSCHTQGGYCRNHLFLHHSFSPFLRIFYLSFAEIRITEFVSSNTQTQISRGCRNKF